MTLRRKRLAIIMTAIALLLIVGGIVGWVNRGTVGARLMGSGFEPVRDLGWWLICYADEKIHRQSVPIIMNHINSSDEYVSAYACRYIVQGYKSGLSPVITKEMYDEARWHE